MHSEWQTFNVRQKLSHQSVYHNLVWPDSKFVTHEIKLVEKLQEIHIPQDQRKLELSLLSGQPRVIVVKGSTWRLGLICILFFLW